MILERKNYSKANMKLKRVFKPFLVQALHCSVKASRYLIHWPVVEACCCNPEFQQNNGGRVDYIKVAAVEKTKTGSGYSVTNGQ
jgi:hypothetical protein